MKVLITTLVRNNEKWIPQFFTMVDRLRSDMPDITFDTYIYENDSTDGTKRLLRGEYHSVDMGHPEDTGTRTQRLAFYRNAIKRKTSHRGYDYVLMVDSNITAGILAFKCLLETLETQADIAMACPHAMVKTSLPCEFYYDTFAMRKGQFDSIFECTAPGGHDRHCHKVTGFKPHHRSGLDSPRLVDFDTCFGGFVLIRGKFYDNDDIWWTLVDSPRDCEHWGFCQLIRKHGGRIVVDRHAKVLWSEV
tara:strand:+ start:8758 stop:9501 length:744 start_codon:yes stop_codon:yes gene_type:complete